MYIDYDDAGKFEKGDEVEAWLKKNSTIADTYPAQTTSEAEKISVKK